MHSCFINQPTKWIHFLHLEGLLFFLVASTYLFQLTGSNLFILTFTYNSHIQEITEAYKLSSWNTSKIYPLKSSTKATTSVSIISSQSFIINFNLSTISWFASMALGCTPV